MEINIRLYGLETLEAELQTMNSIRFDAVQKKQLTQLLNRARAPGGTPIDSGELRKSSGVSKDEMGYTVEYAPHVEYGHRTRNGGWVSGRRFLQKNVDTQRSIYKEDLLKAIRRR